MSPALVNVVSGRATPPKLDASGGNVVVEATPMSDEQSLSEAVVAAIRQGRKIEAIKLLREETGLGLKESKEAVEAYEHRHPAMASQAGPKADSTFGRLLVIAALVAAAVAIYRYFA